MDCVSPIQLVLEGILNSNMGFTYLYKNDYSIIEEISKDLIITWTSDEYISSWRSSFFLPFKTTRNEYYNIISRYRKTIDYCYLCFCMLMKSENMLMAFLTYSNNCFNTSMICIYLTSPSSSSLPCHQHHHYHYGSVNVL